MPQRITQQTLESYLWGAAVLLRGTIDAWDYKQFIFPLLFYKRLCDVFDEETVIALRESGGDQNLALFPENHRFQIPADAHWREIRKVSRDVGRGLQRAMRAIETANPDKRFGIFGDAQWTNKDRLSDAMLRDLIECVLGLGPNLFYNSPVEACVVVCRTQKPKARSGKILFINAVNEVTRERAQSFLTDEHLQRVVRAYQDFKDEPGFTRVVPIEEIRAKEGNLSIPLYVGGETQAQTDAANETATTALPGALARWLASSHATRVTLLELIGDKGPSK
jgi:type I restriction-modification system DNA methylase subunit